ncbi:MAG: hypothetical protein ACK5NT_00645 [Pyrinomonadaceae bacterium]
MGEKTPNVKISAYGVTVGIEVEDEERRSRVIEQMCETIPLGFTFLDRESSVDHEFSIRNSEKLGKFDLFKGEETVIEDVDEKTLLERLDSRVRITIAEFAVGYVFVHAGVVTVKNRAIIIPASSFAGKTTLVAELVKLGAVYYSDEYAVFDKDGLVHPFPKMLSMRERDGSGTQHDTPVEAFGGIAGEEAVKPGLVLVTRYKKYARWKPEILSSGQGVLEIISHTVPIRNDPAFSLRVLNQVVLNAVVVKSDRGEVERFAKMLLEFSFETIQ